MSDAPCRGFGPSRGGFTLIEVIGALVIFSLGVIMVLQLSTALSRQMEYAAKTSEVVARTQERLDSLESVDFASLAVGSQQTTVTVRGASYTLTSSVTKVTAILYQISVTMTPQTAGAGPTFSATSYAAAEW